MTATHNKVFSQKFFVHLMAFCTGLSPSHVEILQAVCDKDKRVYWYDPSLEHSKFGNLTCT